MTTPPPLSDTQLVLLSRASQRDDGLLVPLDTLRGGATREVASKLLIAEFVTEVPVGRDSPHWFLDEGAGRWVGLKVTAAGLRAIGLEVEEPGGAYKGGVPNPVSDAPATKPGPLPASSALVGTKRATVIRLLSRPEGAGLDELIEATGWLPHTTRAALTGLRQRGHTLAKDKDPGGRTVYRISTDAVSSTAQPGTTIPAAVAETAMGRRELDA